MSKDESTSRCISSRGGALVLKSISIFLGNRNNNAKALAKAEDQRTKKKKRNMSEKESKCPSNVYEAVKRDTAFSRLEIDALYKIYKKLASINKSVQRTDKSTTANNVSIIGKPTTVHEGIDRIVFRELIHNSFDLITDDTLMDRIFCAWDKENAGLLTLSSWFKGLAVFLKGSPTEKLEFCFSVYDINADGYITKEEMFQLLKNCLIRQPQDEDPDEGAKDLAEIVLKKLDKDKDGKVSLEDYKLTVDEEPLLLEAFGRCLPDERACDTFLATVKA